MQGLASVIVTFNPTSYRLLENIAVLQRFCDIVYIYDNNSVDGESLKILDEISNKKNISIVRGNKNIGTVGALNNILRLCVKNSYKYLFTFDQDSLIDSISLLRLFEYIKKNKNVALVGPQIIDISNDDLIFEKENKDIFIPSKHVITSGSIVRVNIVKNVGGWDNELFLDAGDIDLNCKLVLANYKVGKLLNTYLQHSVGNRSILNLYFFNITLLNHSNFRNFLMNKNRLILLFRYRRFGLNFVYSEVLAYTKRNISVLFFEDKKLLNLLMLSKGFFSGLRYVVFKK